ncbi:MULTISPECIES: relaxase/mobilization nuclease domain-containing protein [unclassified Sphingopyxis]
MDDDFRLKPGRIRSSGGERNQPAINQVLKAAQRAGGRISRVGKITSPKRSTFGRGRVASVRALHRLTNRSRIAVVKARVVRHHGRSSLAAHLSYIQRDGVSRDQDHGELFGPSGDDVDRNQFAARCEHDRHHFRFIVSPEDAVEMADLKSFTRNLMGQMEKDLGTSLDWAATDHWDTQHPHIHIVVRGVAEDGRDLVIARDYISNGMRARALNLITQELGLRTDLEIRHALERQVEAERWTDLDRDLARSMRRDGFIDMVPAADGQPLDIHALKIGRLRKLEGFGLADQLGSGCWSLHENAEATLRDLGIRNDIIKRMHRAIKERHIERATERFVLDAQPGKPIIGRLVERGLHDELKGSAYTIIDGMDGRTHHIVFPNIEATGDAPSGAIVELRHFEDRRGRARIVLAVRSDMNLAQQIGAPGATWLDRQLVSQQALERAGIGFGAEVTQAMEARAGHLVEAGFARRQGQRIVFVRNLLQGLQQREVTAHAEKLAAELGLAHKPSRSGDYVAGTVRQRITLSSERFAMIDDGLGFQLVPWSPSLDGNIGRHISGVMRGDGHVDWSLGRGRGMGL